MQRTHEEEGTRANCRLFFLIKRLPSWFSDAPGPLLSRTLPRTLSWPTSTWSFWNIVSVSVFHLPPRRRSMKASFETNLLSSCQVSSTLFYPNIRLAWESMTNRVNMPPSINKIFPRGIITRDWKWKGCVCDASWTLSSNHCVGFSDRTTMFAN